MNKVYRYEFKRQDAKRYRYDIIPFQADPMNNPSIVKLPEGFIHIEEISTEYNEYPLGLQSSPIMKVKLDFSALRIPYIGTDPFLELKNALLYPLVTHILTPGYWQEFEFGVLHQLMCLEATDHLPSGAYPFVGIVFEGIQKTGIQANFDLVTNTLELEIESINKVLIEQISTSIFTKSFALYVANEEAGYEYTECDAIIEEFTNKSAHSANAMAIISYNKVYDENVKFCFVKYSQFIKHFFRLYNALYWYAIGRPSGSSSDAYAPYRTVSTTDNFTFFDVTRYKRDEDGDFIPGTYLLENDLYLLGFILKPNSDNFSDLAFGAINNEVIGGLLHPSEKEGLCKYQNMWDFYADYFETTLRKSVLLPYSFDTMPVYGTMAGLQYIDGTLEPKVWELNISPKRLQSIKLKVGDKAIKSVQVSFSEVLEDIDKYEETLENSRNSKSYNLTMNLESKINACNYSLIPSRINIGAYYINTSPSKEHVWGMYYKTNIDDYNGKYFAKVHQHLLLEIDNVDDINSDDLVTPPTSYNLEDYLILGRPSEAAIDSQNTYGHHVIASKSLIEMFGKDRIAELEIEIVEDYIGETSGVTDVLNVLNYTFNIDLGEMEPILSSYGTKWYPISMTYKPNEAIYSINLINKLI
jgi:hypothetical protein